MRSGKTRSVADEAARVCQVLFGVDAEAETVRKRLAVYAAQTRPLVEYYMQWAKTGDPDAPAYRRIAGTGTVEEITARALAALS